MEKLKHNPNNKTQNQPNNFTKLPISQVHILVRVDRLRIQNVTAPNTIYNIYIYLPKDVYYIYRTDFKIIYST